jgi:CRP-like cAMP-binding protein
VPEAGEKLLEQRVSQNPVLGSLPPAARRRIAAAAIVKQYRRPQVVARELESSGRFLLVLEGSAEICRYAEDGRKVIFRTVQPPAGIGYLLLSGEPHTAEIAARDGLRLALIPVALLKEIFSENPQALFRAIARLAGIVDSLSSELLEERTLPLQERVRLAVARNADDRGVLAMSHEELSQCVGATRANVTRALKALQAAGEIQLARRTLRITRLA